VKMQINEFAKLVSVSVRTLHYYDEIGLLKPAFVDEQNGYRFYDEISLERMQEILFYGKIAKITKCFFWITEYTEGFWTSDTYCDTKTVEKRDANPEHYTKQWAKSRLLEVWTVKTKQREDEVTVILQSENAK